MLTHWTMVKEMPHSGLKEVMILDWKDFGWWRQRFGDN